MECSYDDFPTFEPEQESNQSRFERLEARISHLEALLGATHTESGSATQSSPSLPGDSDRLHRFTSSLPSSIHPNGLMDPSVPPAGIATPQTMANLTAITSTHDSESPLPRNHSIFGAVGEASYNVFPGQAATTSADIPMEASPVPIIDMPVIHPFWPPYLPPLELLHHLVETFFTCLPHAGRLLHRGQFVASLSLPPDSPDFPLPALLHAICAVASFYTAIVDLPPLPRIEDMPMEEIFPQCRKKESPNQTFGERHAVWSNLSAYKATERGDNMCQVIQSMVVLSWYHYTAGSYVNVWVINGKACRLVSALGINVSSSFATLSRYNRMPSIIPPPRDKIEAEERRNLMWLIYVAERLQSAGTSWAMLLDDQDISQYLPLSDEDFNAGRDYPEEIRQRLASPDLLTTHPPLLTSPFSLLVKAVHLLSLVKNFNVRARTKFGENVDPRSTPEFKNLDDLITRFKSTWSKEFKEPISSDGKVDPTLYLASLLPSVAVILLHDPHAEMWSSTCSSAKRLEEAAGTIMESIYRISSTSFDILLLDHYSSFCWFMAGMALVRILKSKIDAGAHIEVIKVNSEIEVIKHILLRLSERTIIGRRQIKLLNEHFDNEIGIQSFQSQANTTELDPISGRPKKRTKVSEMLNIAQGTKIGPGMATFDGPIRLR